ncbi:NUDIX hydrolase [Nakamurella endophytica]|uniref:NUDIX hydrolase n=1 Tax=Nakamurella endophytica TaxID=1748367 RepID=A0A917SLA8_9ACTN|nr:NUDIX hydrolase [Nakamurella endophytica]GGL84993.1 NUDIX hydrolase [Nakamurella endophytica]
MPSDSGAIQAAGGLLWRPSRKHGVRVALVRRPRYRDWSLPKGKAAPGETPAVTAAREVQEETGFRPALGRRLTTVSYTTGGRPKTVHYFSARAAGGSWTANREVDRLEWLSPAQARHRMSYDFDRAVLDTFLLQPADLVHVVLVRHARAGSRESYDGDDLHRPLDAKGRKQADALITEILPFAPTRTVTAPPERCRATVLPLADRLGLPLEEEPLLGEDAYRDDPAASRRRLVELAVGRSRAAGGAVRRADHGATDEVRCVVACSQGGVIPGVVRSLAGRADVTVPKVSTPKASFWVLSFDDTQLVQADPYPAPVV